MIIIDKITDNIILVSKSVLHIYSRVNTFFSMGSGRDSRSDLLLTTDNTVSKLYNDCALNVEGKSSIKKRSTEQ